jgi:hypothetical protein
VAGLACNQKLEDARMNRITNRCVVLTLLLPFAAGAHHSFAEFDTETTITLQGVVTEVWFNNPHIRYYVAIAGEDGSEAVWDVHGGAPNRLVRTGWNENTIKVGDQVTLIGNPMHDRTLRINLTRAVLADGTTLPRESRQAP